MVLSRAAFGVTGNAVPTFLSWLLLVGWETVLVSLSTLATATVFTELGWGGGDATKVLGFVITAMFFLGVVFAASVSDPQTGYALTLSEMAPVLRDAASATDSSARSSSRTSLADGCRDRNPSRKSGEAPAKV